MAVKVITRKTIEKNEIHNSSNAIIPKDVLLRYPDLVKGLLLSELKKFNKRRWRRRNIIAIKI